MPLIRIEFDSDKVSDIDAASLSQAIQKIVSEITGIDDVFVYANSPKIQVKAAPIEIFAEMSTHKIADADKLIAEIKTRLSGWKKENNFPHPVNLSLIPMNWKVEIGI